GLQRRLLTALLAARGAVPADPGILATRVNVAHDWPVRHPQLVERANHLLVLSVLSGRLVVRRDPLHHRVDVLVIAGLVDAIDPVLAPLLPDPLRRTQAVHVVDDGSASQR